MHKGWIYIGGVGSDLHNHIKFTHIKCLTSIEMIGVTFWENISVAFNRVKDMTLLNMSTLLQTAFSSF